MGQAHVNTKFIANPSFGIQSVGKQTITLGWQGRKHFITEPKSQWIGFNDIFFGATFLLPLISALSINKDELPVAKSVSLSPSMHLKVGEGALNDPGTMELTGLEVFGYFINQNPIHVTKLNVRASNASYLPSTLEILTPNVFSGQFDRQIVNIVADTNMYQNQSNIVTLTCDFYIARNSILRVDSQFAFDNDGTNEPLLMMDMSFDKYLSLEKALVENYELLSTVAGQENAITQELATVAAKVPAVAETVADSATMGTTLISARTPNWKPIFGSIQPNVGKGNTNYL